MIKIGLVSDLHSEFWREGDHRIIDLIQQRLADADIILLPGDIGVSAEGIRLARSMFQGKPVYMLAGNHEFYDGDYHAVLDELHTNSGDNVEFLHKTVAILNIDGTTIRIIGTTLWTDFALYGTPELSMLQAHINDFRLIRYQGRLLRPIDTLEWHEAERQWLLDQVNTKFDGLTIVMTHHAPVSFACAPQYLNDAVSPCFESRMEHLLIRPDVALVVWGHTHHCVDRVIDTTRFVSNQTGYPGWATGSNSPTETGEFGQIIEL